jgi:putative RNA 2'-phosphotransferase
MLKNADISRVMSHALRHEPWLYELELDDEGWASIDSLIEALRRTGPEWREISRADVERVLTQTDKKRHELVGDRVRALYGHSVPGKLLRSLGRPPGVLYHGTSSETAKVLEHEGLKPMSRQYVHLSFDIATAREVALRKSRMPVLFEIASGAAHEAGVAFYAGNEKVWLADIVPASFLRKMA